MDLMPDKEGTKMFGFHASNFPTGEKGRGVHFDDQKGYARDHETCKKTHVGWGVQYGRELAKME